VQVQKKARSESVAIVTEVSLLGTLLHEKGPRTMRHNICRDEFISLRHLRKVADHLMHQERSVHDDAVAIYVFIVHFMLVKENGCHETRAVDDQRTHSSFFAEICLSLGIVGFDLLSGNLSVAASGWSIDLIYSLFHLGYSIDQNNKQLQDLTSKYSFYKRLRANSSQSEVTPVAERSFPYCRLYENSAEQQLIYQTCDPILATEECARLIEAAEGTAGLRKGWTTNRHYAVPTTDVALHQLDPQYDDTKQWFVEEVLLRRLKPLLCRQFFGDEAESRWREMEMLVNDIFIVKYSAGEVADRAILCELQESSEQIARKEESFMGSISNSECSLDNASSSQRYLPLHADQSSHSLTIALNSHQYSPSTSLQGFLGGGTFFPSLLTESDNSAIQPADGVVRPQQGEVLSFTGSLLHSGHPIICGTRYIIAVFLVLLPPPHCNSASTKGVVENSVVPTANTTAANPIRTEAPLFGDCGASFSFSFFS
jgi:hypothetical protein